MSTPRTARWLYLAVAGWLALAAVRAVFFTGTQLGPLFGRFTHDGVLVLAGALCAARVVLRKDERLAWGLIAAGIFAWAFGECYYTSVLWTVAVLPLPSPADAGYLLMPPLVLGGMVLLMRRRMAGLPHTQWADGFAAALAVGALSAAIVFDTVLDASGGKALGVAVNLSYPLLDLLLMGFVVGALAAAGWRFDRTWTLLLAGVLSFWLADSLYLVRTVHDTFVSDTWIDVAWWAGLALISFAAWQPATDHVSAPQKPGPRLIVMPLLFALVGLSLLVYGTFRPITPLAAVLAAASLCAVMARLVLTFRENLAILHHSQNEALTDALTGLPNRRALQRDLVPMMAMASGDQTVVLVLLDLDGFKLYNDTFGHPAGDSLLIRMGSNLSHFLEGRGKAYRMGGDEFCALLTMRDDGIDGAVSQLAGTLTEHGDGFRISSSFGAVMVPREASNAEDAMKLADHRMYAHKNSARSSAGRQSTDVLLRALAERNPGLSSHVTDVAHLATAVARELGLTEEQTTQIHLAAELHDVGKVAVPDAILHKPGPLNDDEWTFIHEHTLIGERIIAAAPALTEVASIVRSTHERWDGAGYPDGLASTDIPLGSRVVAVADAFDAMTESRPYDAHRSPAAALLELRRCSGTQFDPAVVDAFCVAWARQDSRTAKAA